MGENPFPSAQNPIASSLPNTGQQYLVVLSRFPWPQRKARIYSSRPRRESSNFLIRVT